MKQPKKPPVLPQPAVAPTRSPGTIRYTRNDSYVAPSPASLPPKLARLMTPDKLEGREKGWKDLPRPSSKRPRDPSPSGSAAKLHTNGDSLWGGPSLGIPCICGMQCDLKPSNKVAPSSVSGSDSSHKKRSQSPTYWRFPLLH